MTETAEMLLKKTRNELDDIAVKLGINTAGLAKTKMAEFIVEARKKAAAKETPKPKTETPKAAPSKLKETSKVEFAKQKPKISIGKNGVFAKCEAMEAQIKENNEAVAVIGVGINELNNGIIGFRSDMDKKSVKMHQDGAAMLQQGIKEINKGIKEKLNGIDQQIKANKKAAANMNAGIKELNNGITDMRSDMDKKAKKMLKDGASILQKGVKEMKNGIAEMGASIDNKYDELQTYKHDFYYG